MVRALDDLIDLREPGIQLVEEWIRGATRPVERLPRERKAAERVLLALQVTTRSPLGAIAFETGGILVDGGWIRVLGSGAPRLPRDVVGWNDMSGSSRLAGALLVADDAIGGFFAVNDHAFSGSRGNVFYFSPDTLAWEDLGKNYSEWLSWAFSGDLDAFYAGVRWQGWQSDVATLSGGDGYSIYPFLFASGPPVGERSLKSVPIEELWRLHAIDLPAQLRGRT